MPERTTFSLFLVYIINGWRWLTDQNNPLGAPYVDEFIEKLKKIDTIGLIEVGLDTECSDYDSAYKMFIKTMQYVTWAIVPTKLDQVDKDGGLAWYQKFLLAYFPWPQRDEENTYLDSSVPGTPGFRDLSCYIQNLLWLAAAWLFLALFVVAAIQLWFVWNYISTKHALSRANAVMKKQEQTNKAMVIYTYHTTRILLEGAPNQNDKELLREIKNNCEYAVNET